MGGGAGRWILSRAALDAGYAHAAPMGKKATEGLRRVGEERKGAGDPDRGQVVVFSALTLAFGVAR